MGKILLYLSIVISLLTAAIGFVNHGTLVQTKDKLAATETSLDQTKTSLAKTEADLKKTTEDLATANSEKETLTNKLADSEKKAAAAETKVTELTNTISSKDSEIAQLKTDSDAKDAKIAEYEKNGPGTGASGESTEMADLKSQLAEKEALITTLQASDATNKAQIAEYRDREEQRQKQQMRKGLEGRVLAVNQAWNFVVLSLGDRNGVSNNAEMLVKRGSQLIGKVKITSVEPSSSIADIVSNNSGKSVSIQPGDNVIYQGNE